MRFWVGNELEGKYKGIKTLFVESNVFNTDIFNKINQIASNEKVLQIYLGAGSIDVEECKDIKSLRLLKDCYIVSIESTSWKDWFDKDLFHNIILTSILPSFYNNITVKVKNNDSVYCFPLESGIKTDLSLLKDGMFIHTDKEIIF